MASDPCRCGNLGCLETLAGTRAVVERARALAPESGDGGLAPTPEAMAFDSLVQAFEADPLARRVVTGAGRYMGQAVPGLMGALNVQRIVIAGAIARFGLPRLEVIRDTIPRSTLARLAGETSVGFEHLGHNEIILGASALTLRDYSLAFRRQPRRPEATSSAARPRARVPVVPDGVIQGVPTTGRRAGARAGLPVENDRSFERISTQEEDDEEDAKVAVGDRAGNALGARRSPGG